jgi:hypothetical protein
MESFDESCISLDNCQNGRMKSFLEGAMIRYKDCFFDNTASTEHIKLSPRNVEITSDKDVLKWRYKMKLNCSSNGIHVYGNDAIKVVVKYETNPLNSKLIIVKDRIRFMNLVPTKLSCEGKVSIMELHQGSAAKTTSGIRSIPFNTVVNWLISTFTNIIKNNLLYTDIKPDNMLVTMDLMLHLGDLEALQSNHEEEYRSTYPLDASKAFSKTLKDAYINMIYGFMITITAIWIIQTIPRQHQIYYALQHESIGDNHTQFVDRIHPYFTMVDLIPISRPSTIRILEDITRNTVSMMERYTSESDLRIIAEIHFSSFERAFVNQL